MESISLKSGSSRSRHSQRSERSQRSHRSQQSGRSRRSKATKDECDDYSQSSGVETSKSMYTIKKIEEYVNFELSKAKQRELEVEMDKVVKRREGTDFPDDKASLFSAPTVDADEMSVEISLGTSRHSYYSKNDNDSTLGKFLKKSNSNKLSTVSSRKSSSSKSLETAPPKMGSQSFQSNSENLAPNGQNESKLLRKKSNGYEDSESLRSGSIPGTVYSTSKSTMSGSTSSSKKHEAHLSDAIRKLQVNESVGDASFGDDHTWDTKLERLAFMIEDEKNKTVKLEELEKLLGEKKSRIRNDTKKAKWIYKVDELEKLLEAKRIEKNTKLNKLAHLLDELKAEKRNKAEIYAILKQRSEDGSKNSTSSKRSNRNTSYIDENQSIDQGSHSSKRSSSSSKISSSILSRLSKSSSRSSRRMKA